MTDAPPPPPPPSEWEREPSDRRPTPPPPGPPSDARPPPDWVSDRSEAPFAYPPPPPSAAVAPYAAWWRRLVAALLDFLIVAVPTSLLGSMFGLLEAVRDVDGDLVDVSASTGLSVLSFVAALAYWTVMEGGRRGATIGKMALLIQVRDAQTGGPIGFPRALGRRFIFLILFQLLLIPGAINALSPLWDARKQAWHDKAVNSVVVNAPRP